MPENTTPYQLPEAHIVGAGLPSELADGQIVVAVANGAAGLETAVIDVRNEVPDAFPPRHTETRTVTDQASFILELSDRPLITQGQTVRSTVWANRKQGTITAIYDDHQADAVAEYADRGDRLVLQFVTDPDWTRFLKAADSEYHSQNDFADLIESVGHLITSHQAAELMEIVGSIRASSKGAFESSPNRANATEVTFHVARFEDYPAIDITCWLRFQIRGGDLSLTLVPQPYEHRVQASWIDVVETLATTIEHPIYAANL